MKKSLSVIMVLGLLSLSGFTNESSHYEQIAFDYFVSDILKTDYKDVTSFGFKGKTEESFSTFGKYEYCLKKMETILAKVIKGVRINAKEIEFRNVQGLTITDFQSKTSSYKLLLYPSVRVADNYYVFLLFQKLKERPVKYTFEMTPEGKVSNSCRMD